MSAEKGAEDGNSVTTSLSPIDNSSTAAAAAAELLSIRQHVTG